MTRRLIVVVLFAIVLVACKRQDLAHRTQAKIKASIPGATVEIVDDSTLRVKTGTGTVTVSLDNLATVCRTEPARCDGTMDRLVASLASSAKAGDAIDPSSLRATLRSRETVEQNRATIAAKSPPDKVADNQLCTFPFQGDMFLVLVRDMPDGILMLSHGALTRLKLDEGQARALALSNTANALKTLPTEVAAPGVLRIRTDDSYESARLLVPKLWDDLVSHANGDLLVVAPTRDIVYATGSADPAAVSRMKELAQKAYDAGPYALSTALLRRGEQGFVLAGSSGKP